MSTPTLTSFTSLVSDFYGYEDLLTDREKSVLADLRHYLETEVKPIVNDHWARAEFPTRIVKGLADLGIFALPWEETRPFENSAVFRGWVALELARVDASVATFVGVQNGLAMGSISVGGSPEQRAEPLSGSDSAQGLRTVATRDGDDWVLNGSKRWIGNATFSDVTIIWAKSAEDGQVKGFIVPTTTPGYTATKIEDKQSLRIVQNADIVLDGVRVPESMRLQQANSFRDTASVLRLTRAEVAWAAVGNSIGAYEAALAYAGERVQFGKPIAAHQLIQDRQHHRLARHGGPRVADARRRGAARRARLARQGVHDRQDARDRRVRAGGARRQRDRARVRRRTPLRRRRGPLQLRGHPGDEHAHRRAQHHRPGGLRLSTGPARARRRLAWCA
jgi:glutaryl-CoA dehydrogenase